MRGDLPIDLDRLKAQFPNLTDEDLHAYVTVTRRVLGDPAARAKAMREVMTAARQAEQKAVSGANLTPEEQLLTRYLAAMAKMQTSTTRKLQ